MDHIKREEELDSLNELTFQPRLEAKEEVKKFSGPAADSTIQSGNSYVERQMKVY